MKWNPGIVTENDILIINDPYCIQAYKDLNIKPRRTIMWFHNGYETMKHLVDEMVKRKTIDFDSVEEFEMIVSTIECLCIVNIQQPMFFNRQATLLPTPVTRVQYKKKEIRNYDF